MAKDSTISEEAQNTELSSLTPEGGTAPEENSEGLEKTEEKIPIDTGEITIQKSNPPKGEENPEKVNSKDLDTASTEEEAIKQDPSGKERESDDQVELDEVESSENLGVEKIPAEIDQGSAANADTEIEEKSRTSEKKVEDVQSINDENKQTVASETDIQQPELPIQSEKEESKPPSEEYEKEEVASETDIQQPELPIQSEKEESKPPSEEYEKEEVASETDIQQPELSIQSEKEESKPPSEEHEKEEVASETDIQQPELPIQSEKEESKPPSEEYEKEEVASETDIQQPELSIQSEKEESKPPSEEHEKEEVASETDIQQPELPIQSEKEESKPPSEEYEKEEVASETDIQQPELSIQSEKEESKPPSEEHEKEEVASETDIQQPELPIQSEKEESKPPSEEYEKEEVASETDIQQPELSIQSEKEESKPPSEEHEKEEVASETDIQQPELSIQSEKEESKPPSEEYEKEEVASETDIQQPELSIQSEKEESKPPSEEHEKEEVASETDIQQPELPIQSEKEESKPPSEEHEKEEVASETDIQQPDLPNQSKKEESVVSEEGTSESEADVEIRPGIESDYAGQDFKTSSIEEIVEIVKTLGAYKDLTKADKVLRRFTGRISELRSESRSEALKKFVDEGGVEDDFTYKQDELFDVFDANFRLIKDKRRNYLKDLERQKESNLAKAEVLLDRLREFLDDEETNTSFKIFKEIQGEWKRIGSLPGSNYRSLWANYNALVSRFYDRRSIYFELIELDRKKNLEYKFDLCEKAENLEGVKDLRDAIMQLNELHHEFKHTGPVPKSEQEDVWKRFKGASDKIYARRKEYNSTLRKELDENLKLKMSIVEKIQAFSTFDSDKIKDWNLKSREIMDIQKEWEKIGGLPRDKAKEINKKFWSAFKTYFGNKNKFFKRLEGQRDDNLKSKEELVQQAEALKESTDWEKTASEMKNLQQQWKDIGPVPEKVRNEIFMKFKAACDHFFDKRREEANSAKKDYEENLKKKNTIIKELQKISPKEETDVEKIKDLQAQFYDAGYVPKSEIVPIQDKFSKALKSALEKTEGMDEDTRDEIILEGKLEKIRHSPNAGKKFHQKEHNLRKQITKIESDIAVWRNNLEFFANTKNAEKLKSDFRIKISEADHELDMLKKQLRLIMSS